MSIHTAVLSRQVVGVPKKKPLNRALLLSSPHTQQGAVLAIHQQHSNPSTGYMHTV